MSEPLGLRIYRLLTSAAEPLSGLLFAQRLKRGRENPERVNERRGIASVARPLGPLVWLHGASVGELTSVLPLISHLHARGLSLLVTSGTVTSSQLAEQRLPGGGSVGPADALIMARSGLDRVGLASRIAYEFSISEMLPAVGQGIVAVECAIRDFETRRILSAIDDATAHACADAEREVLWVHNGHCNSPVAGFSRIDGAQMSLTASVLDEAGLMFIEASRSGPADRPRELGRAVGLELLAKGAAEIIERTRPV